MALWSDAQFVPITENFNQGRMVSPIKGLIIHITDGASPGEGKPKMPPSLRGVWGWFCNPKAKASANFCVAKDGEVWQFVDTSNRAWSVDGNTIDAQWISIENIALPGERLTDEQVDICAGLFGWLHRQSPGVSLAVASGAAGSGLAYHSLFGKGHPGCPGMAVIAQLNDILELSSAAYS
ncbi:MAG: N-acetylmuramoyl-L-alanine amidase [Acidobacteriota bacterium]|nr:N-acetylmuramoyl-L-alanine amidase [Acidobacteriota bacterium]